MLRDILLKKKISVYEAAKASGIPYTTLSELANGKKNPRDCSIRTILKLADYLDLSVETLLQQLQAPSSERPRIATTWEDARRKKYRFPVIVPEAAGFDVSRVHPLKQRQAAAVFAALQQDDRVEEAFLFGSSVSIRCNQASDADFAVKLKDEANSPEAKNQVSETMQELCGWKADILWLEKLKEGSPIYENVMRGVRLK